jgi:hypothetical protein
MDFFPCSQCVLIRFPKGYPSSQVVTQDVPNSTLDYSHMVCLKFNRDVYKLKRWTLGKGAHLVLF